MKYRDGKGDEYEISYSQKLQEDIVNELKKSQKLQRKIITSTMVTIIILALVLLAIIIIFIYLDRRDAITYLGRLLFC